VWLGFFLRAGLSASESETEEGKGAMSIVFFCQSCGARFEVDPRFAGKKGHCKKCGQYMAIPRAEEIASMAAIPALAGAAGGGEVATRGATGSPPASIGSWLQESLSKVALAPITVERMRIGKKKPSMFAEDELADSKPYTLAKPDRRQSGGTGSRPAGIVTRAWRGQLGWVQKLFRKINQLAYLVSVPFLIILLIGAVVGNRPIALFGATLVVLLNIGRLVAGIANLAVIPLRDGIDFKKMKKPLGRVIEPAVTIALVVLAFTFIPWLSRDQVAGASIADRIRSEAKALKQDMRGQVDQVLDVEKLSTQAQEKLKNLGEMAKDADIEKLGAQAQEKIKQLGSSSSSGPAKKRSTGRVRATLDALEKRTQEELDKAKALEEQPQKP
jgi:hypothetical protein